jgi:phospholipase/carboxylesterase
LVDERPTVGKVIVSGFSQGGLLTLTMALYHDDIVGEAFPLSCWLPAPLEPSYRRADLRFPHIRSMHGTDDQTIPLAPTSELFTRLAVLGFDVSLHTFPNVGHTISDDENELFHLWLEAAVCRVVGDADCELRAESAASEMSTGVGLVDAGPPAAPDAARVGSDAAEPDGAGSDAGRARAPRRTRADSGGVIPAHTAAPEPLAE